MPQPLGNSSPEWMLTPVSEILQMFAILKPQELSSQQIAYLRPFMTDVVISHYAGLEKIALASNFILLPLADIALKNAIRNVPLVGLTKHWLLFASTSQGDAWLIRQHALSTEIGFLDHNQSNQATVTVLGINFEQWLQVAFLMFQIETRALNPTRIAFDAALNSLHPELSIRYPYQTPN